MTRLNLATDPRGSGTALWDLSGFAESAGDPLAGFSTSRRFTRRPPADGVPLTNYGHLLDSHWYKSTGVWSRTVDGENVRFTCTTQGNTGWSDALSVYPAMRPNSGDFIPITPGQIVSGTFEWRGNRPRAMRWRLSWCDAAGTNLASIAASGRSQDGENWTSLSYSGMAPADLPTLAGVKIYVGSGGTPSGMTPAGFITGDYVELRRAIIVIDGDPAPIYWDGATPDVAPSESAVGTRYDWTGAVGTTASTATPIPQSSVALPVEWPVESPVIIRAELQASEPFPGGRLVVRHDLGSSSGETLVLSSLDIPAGGSELFATVPELTYPVASTNIAPDPAATALTRFTSTGGTSIALATVNDFPDPDDDVSTAVQATTLEAGTWRLLDIRVPDYAASTRYRVRMQIWSNQAVPSVVLYARPVVDSSSVSVQFWNGTRAAGMNTIDAVEVTPSNPPSPNRGWTITGTTEPGRVIKVSKILIETADEGTAPEWFSGSSPDTPAGAFAWTGATNDSPSTWTPYPTGFALVWGAESGAADGGTLDVTGILVEPTDARAPAYFDGWTLDVPPTAAAPGIDYYWTGPAQASPSATAEVAPLINDTRDRIAAALSTVDGVTGSPTSPRTLGRGQGWPVWQARTPLTMRSDELRWLVHVTLPPGLLASSALEADVLTEQVLIALSSVGVIERVEPDALASVQDGGSSPVPALTVTMTTVTDT